MNDSRDERADHRAGLPGPELPPSHHAYPGVMLRDQSNRLRYELYRVYGPAERRGQHALLCPLDPDKTFWLLSWPVAGGEDDGRMAHRWLSYTEARQRSEPQPSFAEFCTLQTMHERFPGLLYGEDFGLEPVLELSVALA